MMRKRATHWEKIMRADVARPIRKYLHSISSSLQNKPVTFEQFTQEKAFINAMSIISSAFRLDTFGGMFSSPNMSADQKMNEEMNSSANMLYQLYMFGIYKRVFHISNDLTYALCNTNSNADVSFVKSPYRNIYLSFDNVSYQIPNMDTGLHKLYGIYITENESESEKDYQFLAVGANNENSSWELDDGIMFMRVILPLEGKLHKVISYNLPKKDHPRYDDYCKAIKTIIKLSFNILLYMNSVNSDVIRFDGFDFEKRMRTIKNSYNKNKANMKIIDLNRLSSLPGYDVGRNIRISKTSKGSGKIPVGSSKWKLKYRYWVRGHWRNQAYGEKLSKRKVIWIEPFQKGPDTAEIIKRDYIVSV